jgi:uncharacterized protein (DUF1330 family)
MTVTSKESYDDYKKVTTEIVSRYGGRFVTRGGQRVALEGRHDKRRIVIVEFPSLLDAKNFYCSSEYQSAMLMRQGAAMDVELFLVEGFECE